MKFISDHYEKVKLVIFVLLVGSLPFHHMVSTILIMAAVLLSFWRAYPFRKIGKSNWDRLSVLLICYFLLEVIGLGYTDTENIGNGLFNLDKHLGFVFIPLIFLDFKINARSRRILLITFVVSCFIASLVCIIGNMYISMSESGGFFHEWRFSHNRFSEPIGMQAVYFSMHLGLAVLIIISELMKSESLLSNFKKALLIIILLLYFFVVIVALGARTVTLALLVIIMGNLLFYACARKSFKILLATILVPFIFIGFILLNPVVTTRFLDMTHNKTEGSNYDSYFARTNIWKPGIEVIKENIWFGVGTGDDQRELDKKFIKYDYLLGVQLFNMHNQYFQVLLNFGIFGFILFLIILFVQLKESIAKRDLLYLSFLMLFMAGCVTESMLCRNKGIIFFLVFSFIFYKSTKETVMRKLTEDNFVQV